VNGPTQETWRAVRRIEITTGRLVSNLFAGRYLSTFKGRGMEFLEVREYAPGDDPRTIDWNVTAKLGHLYVKRYAEERELTLLIVLDVSRSLDFGSAQKTKSEISAELTALLSFAALRNNDKVGMIMFSDEVEQIVPPRKSRRHALRLVRDALGHTPTGAGTDIAQALRVLNQVARRRAIVFIISDFISEGYEKVLATTRLHHDTIPIVLADPREDELPDAGVIQLEDAETGGFYLLDTSNPEHRLRYKEQARLRRRRLQQLFGKIGMDSVFLKTNESYVQPLIRLFETRARRFR
jgi:uncharacterized protein (DUF58 family)